ncbi:helix-turn-helix domain-containing protein [Flavobacterium ardleyense]|uniref:Helix-turn-helix domain-containing protein n=1 Tax=Flavobacterium ardleyense TaxID=2038737 RepID=A0ABW5Z543_9FLAO
MRKVLKDLRTEANLTQDSVITDIFDSKNITLNLARIETGEGNISPSTLFLLCQYYNISISKFYKRVEDLDSKLMINKK